MQLRLIISLNLLLSFISTYGQELSRNEMSKYLYQIYACDDRHKLSGFMINGKKGIYTSLHGVIGCKNIKAENGQTQIYKNLRITMVDVPHDVALLSSNEMELLGKDGLAIDDPDFSKISEVRIWGYSFGGEVVMDNLIPIRQYSPIINLRTIAQINPNVFSKLNNRGSPALGIQVINLQGGMKTGSSGAAITNKGKLIGIGAGEIPQEGGSDFAFGIPFSEVNLCPLNAQIQEQLNRIANMRTDGLFNYEHLIVNDDMLINIKSFKFIGKNGSADMHSLECTLTNKTGKDVTGVFVDYKFQDAWVNDWIDLKILGLEIKRKNEGLTVKEEAELNYYKQQKIQTTYNLKNGNTVNAQATAALNFKENSINILKIAIEWTIENNLRQRKLYEYEVDKTTALGGVFSYKLIRIDN